MDMFFTIADKNCPPAGEESARSTQGAKPAAPPIASQMMLRGRSDCRMNSRKNRKQKPRKRI